MTKLHQDGAADYVYLTSCAGVLLRNLWRGNALDFTSRPLLVSAMTAPSTYKGRTTKILAYPALVAVDDGRPQQPCTVSEVSAWGAVISLDEAASLPGEFTLLLAGENGPRRRCRALGCFGRKVAVEFIKGERPTLTTTNDVPKTDGPAQLDC